MAAHPVNWFQISGTDGNELAGFYKSVFGWKMSPSPDGSPMSMVAPEKGGIPGGVATAQNGQANVTVYISCDDIDGHLQTIEGAGGHTAMPKMELPGGMGFIAGFTDPQGNWVGLWQPGKPAPKPRKAAAKKKPAKKPGKKPAKKAKARRR